MRLVTLGGAAFLAVAFLLMLSGCAVGRDDATGAIVLGFEAGRLVETAPQALAGLAGSLIPGLGPVVSLAAGALGIGGTAAAVHYRSKRRGERDGWDEKEEDLVYPAPVVQVHTSVPRTSTPSVVGPSNVENVANASTLSSMQTVISAASTAGSNANV